MPGHIPTRTAQSRTVLGLATALLLIFHSFTASAQIHLDLPAQPLAQALTTLGSLANLNIYFDPAAVDGIRSPALKAELRPDDALARLLAGTRLRAVRVDENTVRVIADPGEKRAQSTHAPSTGAAYVPNSVHLAYAGDNQHVDAESRFAAADPSADSAGNTGASESRRGLEEVVVTAEKREERLQDVPVPVTAISADTLVESNQLRIQDYYSSVPGINVSPMGLHSVQTLSMRGITTGSFGNSPVAGITIDDVPLGSSTSVGGGVVAPDIDPSDLSRIEVLRGPQGTLYGASSLGGLLKFVTADPSTEGLSARIQAGTEAVHNGDGAGYSFRGSINAPLNDTLAVRLSGFTREDPGYVDNPIYNLRDVNEIHARGGQLSALWRPTDTFSLKLSALYQDQNAGGSSDINVANSGYVGPPLGDLQQTYFPGIGKNERKVEAYSATARLKFGGADLTSVTGYNVVSYFDTFDFSYALGAFANSLFPPADGGPIYEHGITNKFTQELRLAMPLGSRIDWLLGGYYTHESSRYFETIYATDIATGNNLGVLYLTPSAPTDSNIFEEYAAFTDLTFHITDQFDIQIGARESHIKQSTANLVGTGPLVGGVAITNPTATSYSPFTYLFTPEYKFSKDLMVYSRLASGYRAGGGGSQGPTATCVVNHFPCSYNPDKTYNYEVGIKGDTLDRMLTFDASVFYIDWKDIQVAAVSQGLYGYISNGGKAKSQGAELSLDIRPLDQLTLSARFAYTDAVLTENFPGFPNGSVYGASGNRLPDTSRFTAYFAAERSFTLSSSLTALLGADVRYVGDHMGQFNSTPERQYFPPYAQTDAHVGLIYDTWSATLFVNNVTDRRGLLAGGLGTYPPFAFTVIQPRTVGLTLSKTF
jgi:iron complex outermembrane recepter protein